jgi:hypothetical protein
VGSRGLRAPSQEQQQWHEHRDEDGAEQLEQVRLAQLVGAALSGARLARCGARQGVLGARLRGAVFAALLLALEQEPAIRTPALYSRATPYWAGRC